MSMKLLAPVDQSRRDGIVLPYCSRLAKGLEAAIIIVHSVPLPRSVVPGAVREAEAYVFAAKEGLREQGLAVDGLVRRGDPSTVIAQVADELDVDMIVMASRGRSSLGKLILGSVADSVLSNCRKPVLLLSETGHGLPTDDEVLRQSAYLATVIWNKRARGEYTEEQASEELERLASSGLDREALFASYRALEERGVPLSWLDIDFQLSTLRRFLPEEVDSFAQAEPPQFPKPRAA